MPDIRCANCRAHFCFLCGAVAESTSHFLPPNTCKQHTALREREVKEEQQ